MGKWEKRKENTVETTVDERVKQSKILKVGVFYCGVLSTD